VRTKFHGKQILQKKTSSILASKRLPRQPVGAEVILRTEAERLKKLPESNLVKHMIWAYELSAAKIEIATTMPQHGYIGKQYKPL
jgi:hypothetical protein